MQSGGPFPQPGGRNDQRQVRQPEDGHSQGEGQVPAENHHCQPGGDYVGNTQGDEAGGHEEFVRQGVEISPQGGFLMPPAGHQPVQHVAQTREEKNYQPLAVLPLDQKYDEQGCQEDASQGDEVGNGEAGSGIGLRSHSDI